MQLSPLSARQRARSMKGAGITIMYYHHYVSVVLIWQNIEFCFVLLAKLAIV